MSGSASQRSGRRVARWLALAGICFAGQAVAATFFEDVQESLTCTKLATPDERAALRADWLTARDAAGQRRYFNASRPGTREYHFRYLTLLQAVANLADEVDDQAFRRQVLTRIIQHSALKELDGGKDVLFRQIQRCAWSQAVESLAGSGDASLLRGSLRLLAASYSALPVEQPVEDWPLILTLRDLRAEPGATQELTGLAALMLTRGNAYSDRRDTPRAQRAWIAGARGLLSLGENDKAYQAALAGVQGNSTAAGISHQQRWLAYPVLFDYFIATGKPMEAMGLEALFQGNFTPPDARDAAANFEVFHRLARSADSIVERYINDAQFRGRTSSAELDRQIANASRFAVEADRAMKDYHITLTSLRRALHEVAQYTYDPDFLPQLTRANPGYAAELAATYFDMAKELAATHVKSSILVNKRSRLIYRRQYSKLIGDFARLLPYLPREAGRIVEQTFTLAQMASQNGAAAVATSGLMGLNREGVSSDSLTWNLRMIESPAAFLEALLRGVEAGNPAGRNPALDTAFQAILLTRSDVFENREQFAAAMLRRDPQLASFMLGTAFSIPAFQKFLGAKDVLVATHLARDAVHVWVVTARGARMVSTPVPAAEVESLVTHLRASVEQAVKDPLRQSIPYDAAAAWRLFEVTLGPVMADLKGAARVYWYGDRSLAALPPAILLTKAPAKPQLATFGELNSAAWLAKEFPLVSMPELSIYPLALNPSRKAAAGTGVAGAPEFLGIGGTQLSAQELGGESFARSLELAGGDAGAALADLPKLEATVGTLRAIEQVVGSGRSTLWLGPEATKKRLLDADLRQYRVLVLATHGFLPGEMDECLTGPYPSLLLSPAAGSTAACGDSLLTTREISQLKLDADLVVLSACNTARGGSRGGAEEEPFLGLAASFGAAGARNLAVSHWPVLVGAAGDLTAGMIRESRADGVPIDVSLQRSIEQLRAGARTALEAHPAYWGPFVLVGSGRSTLRGE